ncbi:gas vesicle protein [Streptomyces californicus]|uniref:gas vesicle protein n=1 Tax=Streptomyces californicus TaxID=67351 RepID=UPI0037FFEA78
MTDLDFRRGEQPVPGPQTSNLADILERVLDKGIVVAGDIKIDLLDIELLTIRLRLFVASVDTAKKAGIDWWETDPALSSRASRNALEEENRELRERLRELDASADSGEAPAGGPGSRWADGEGRGDGEERAGREKESRRR